MGKFRIDDNEEVTFDNGVSYDTNSVDTNFNNHDALSSPSEIGYTFNKFVEYSHKLVKFFVIENPMYLGEMPIRNIRVKYNNETVTKLGDIIVNKGAVNRQDISKRIPNLVQVSDVPDGFGNIDNGWGTSRYRVMLVIESMEMNSPLADLIVTYIQGYTDTLEDFEINGIVNPNIRIIVNSAVTEYITKDKRDKILLRAEAYQNNMPMFGYDQNGNIVTPDKALMRPNDIYATLDNQINVESNAINGSNIYDDRVKTMDVRSLNPAEYGASIINPYLISSKHSSPYGGSVDPALSAANSLTHEYELNTSPFLNVIAELYGMTDVASFTIRDLESIVFNEVVITRPSSVVQPMTNTQGTAANLYQKMNADIHNVDPLTTADISARIATTVVNTLKGHMLSEFVSMYGFVGSNMLTADKSPVITPNLIRSIKTQNDSAALGRLTYLTTHELWNLLSSNEDGQLIPITISAVINLFGDSFVAIELGGVPNYYRIPSMASAKISPVIGDMNKVDKIANETRALLNNF